MRLQDDIDFTTLTWVKAELDETLKQARHALEAYVEDPTDASQMRFCATYLHQVQGTLRMVELYGAAMVTEEMEHLASALLENDVKDREEAYGVLMRGIVQLPDYLERLQTGHKDIPIVLLPLLNDLRGARGEKSLSEIVLFTPDLTRPLPLSAKGPLASLPEQELRQYAEQLRGQFQLALLNWFRNADVDANVSRIAQVCDKLVAIVAQEEARRLFWVAAGVMEALRAKAFEPSPQLRQTIGKVEREIKRLADAGENSFRVDPPRELTRNLLYFVAHAPTEHGRIGELRQIFRLESLLPTEAEIAHARGSMSGHNRALIDTVSVAIKEDLMRVKDALDFHLRTENASPEGLASQVEVLDRVSDTLGMLGLGVARRVVQEQRTAVHQVATGARASDEATLLDIAGALLYVEASLDDQVQHLGGGAAELESGSRALPQAEARKVLDALVKEAQANFAQAKQCFVAFIESNWDHAQLQDVPRLLEEVSGAMRILELTDPPQYLLAIRRFTEAELLARKRVPNGQQMDTLADALASLEYYLEAVREHRAGRDKILEVTRNSLETLGYWPVPDAEVVPVPVPEASVAAPPVAIVEPVFDPAPVFEAPASQVAAVAAVEITAPTPDPAPAKAAVAGILLSGFEGASDEIDEEIREVFIEEVQEEITNLGELLPSWKNDPQQVDLLKPIRRVFHTLKGSGRLVGALTLGEFSWKMENMLNRVLDKSIQPTTAVQAIIGHAYEVLPRLLAALRGEGGVRADIEGIKAVAERLTAGEQAWYEPVAVAVPEPVPTIGAEPVEQAIALAEEAPIVEPEMAVEDELPMDADSGQMLASIDPVLFDILKTEVAGHLETMHEYLDAANASPRPATDALLRAVHTMNGAFAMTDVPVITEVVGPLEGYIKRLLAQSATPSATGLAAIGDAAEAVRVLMLELEAPRPRLPDLGELTSRIVAERDALPEPVGPSMPLHLEIDEGEAELTEAVSIAPPLAPPQVLDDVAAETEIAAASKPFVDSTETRAEESFPSFASELSGFDSEPVFDLASIAPAAVEFVTLEVPVIPESEPISADAAVSVFEWPEADATVESAPEPLAFDTGTAAEPSATTDELLLDETAFEDFAFEEIALEEPAIMEPELSEPSAEMLEEFDAASLQVDQIDAAFGVAETPSRDATVEAATPEPVFDESHIDSVRAAEPAADITAESPVPVMPVPLLETEAREVAEEFSFEAELLALGDLDVGTDTLEFEILEAADEEGHDLLGLELEGKEAEGQKFSNDRILEPRAFASVDVPLTPVVPRLDDSEVAGAALAAETPKAVAADDATSLEAMIAAYEAAPTGVDEAAVLEAGLDAASEAADVKAADVNIDAAAFAAPSARDDALTIAAAAAAREAAELAELDAQIAALEAADVAAVAANETAAREAAIVQLEAEQAAEQSHAAAVAAQEATELVEREAALAARAAADAEAETAALAAVEVAAAQAAADAAANEVAAADAAAKDAAVAAEAIELAELEAEIAALDAAEAETARLAAEAVQSEPEISSFAADESSLLPDAPLADYAAEASAEEADAREAVATRAAPVPATAAFTTGLAEADADPEGALELPDLDEELLDIFLEEGGDLLDHSDGLMARLRENPADRELVIGLQRDLHTLKGGARMAGIAPIGDLGHAMESLLEAVAEGKRELTGIGLETLERAFDRLHSMVTRVGKRQALAMPLTLIDRVEALGRGETLQPLGAAAPVAAASESAVVPQRAEPTPTAMDIAAEALPAPAAHSAPLSEPMADEDDISVRAPQEQIRIRADLLDRLVNYAGEVAIYRARLEQQLGLFRGNLGELDQTTTRLKEQLRKLEIETEAQIVARYQREADVGDSAFDPLELDRFSTLQQLSRALSESAADIVNLQTTLEDHTRQYETLLLQQSRVSSELQEGLMRTRMVPFDSLVPRLRRIIRQTAGELGKKAQLKVEGAQGEMDRNVLDRMTAPLEHMLRNALAHGLETPEVRVAAGKPEEGTVRIAVQREGSEVVITVSDDGRGLDRDAIRNKAMERGLMKADAQLSDRDLYGFILETGFSTATTVSKIAGRGVGMDVVHSEIRQLGGSLYINSERGKGSEFVVRLPFTLAVTQAVFVKHGDTMFSVPISSVQGVARIDRATLEEQIASGEPTFTYAGETYSIYDLGLLLGQSHVRAEDSLQVPLLLARSGDQRAAICVDQVIGSREIVVKPVGPQVSSIPGIFGATVMGDGRVIVILDFAPLVRRSAAMRKSGDAPVIPVPVEQRRIPLVMVVDDSITMRKVTGRVLERHNYEVITAKDGVDAIEKLQERIPDVMLLDIEMPRMDGYELATHMRNDGRLRGIPIIMITSRTGEKHRQRAFEIGVDRYLGKPYQENELMRNVHEILKVGRGGVG